MRTVNIYRISFEFQFLFNDILFNEIIGMQQIGSYWNMGLFLWNNTCRISFFLQKSWNKTEKV